MFLPPMLLEKRENPFDDDRYIFEPKIDGHRLILSMEAGQVRLFTRHNNDVTLQYPELHDVPIDDSSDVVLDGEVACQNEDGAIEFELVMERFLKRKPLAIRQAMVRQPVHYYVFDILRYNGRDLRPLPLTERKRILQQVLSANKFFSPVLSVPGTGVALFEAIKEKKLEGIVAKLQKSRYVGRRAPSWIKIINYTYDVVQIAGYRKNQFGWLLSHRGRPVGLLEHPTLVPLKHKQAFYGVARSLVSREDRDFVYLEPRINARVRFRNWTRKGMLRSPEFVGFIV